MSDYDDDEMFSDSFTWMTFNFKTLRVVDNVITAHVNTLKTEIIVKENCSERDLNIALEKIHFWFEHIVGSTIMFCRDNEFALNMMFGSEGQQLTGNFPMVLADDPSDDYLAIVFQSKLNALGGDKVLFSMVELTSDTRENLTSVFVGYSNMYLPDMVDWVGERSYHSQPWWKRNDGSTFDVIPAESSDLTKVPSFGYDISFIEQKFTREDHKSTIIVRPEFKPTVIKGGLDSDKPED